MAAATAEHVGRKLGTEVFPRVEAGQLQVRLRAPTGTQLTGTEKVALKTLDLETNNIGAAGARSLAESPHLGGLVSLDLIRNPLGGRTSAGREARQALKERFGERVDF